MGLHRLIFQTLSVLKFVSLPLYPDISIEQLDYIISKLEEFLEKIMIDIGRKSIGDNAPCYITLAGPTFDGFESAKKLVEVAAKSKADAIHSNTMQTN